MKNIHQYLICISLLILTSCEKEFRNTYIVKNESDYTLNITAYDINVLSKDSIEKDSTKIYTEIYKILSKAELIKIKNAGYGWEPQGIFEDTKVDSISIVFDSLRIITFACEKPSGSSCTGEYNLMDYENNFEKVKSGRSSGVDEYTYTFVFTNEDFEKALVIEKKK